MTAPASSIPVFGCEHCGGPFVLTRPSRRYCSPQCRRKASAERRRRDDPTFAEKHRDAQRRYLDRRRERENSWLTLNI